MEAGGRGGEHTEMLVILSAVQLTLSPGAPGESMSILLGAGPRERTEARESAVVTCPLGEGVISGGCGGARVCSFGRDGVCLYYLDV